MGVPRNSFVHQQPKVVNMVNGRYQEESDVVEQEVNKPGATARSRSREELEGNIGKRGQGNSSRGGRTDSRLKETERERKADKKGSWPFRGNGVGKTRIALELPTSAKKNRSSSTTPDRQASDTRSRTGMKPRISTPDAKKEANIKQATSDPSKPTASAKTTRSSEMISGRQAPDTRSRTSMSTHISTPAAKKEAKIKSAMSNPSKPPASAKKTRSPGMMLGRQASSPRLRTSTTTRILTSATGMGAESEEIQERQVEEEANDDEKKSAAEGVQKRGRMRNCKRQMQMGALDRGRAALRKGPSKKSVDSRPPWTPRRVLSPLPRVPRQLRVICPHNMPKVPPHKPYATLSSSVLNRPKNYTFRNDQLWNIARANMHLDKKLKSIKKWKVQNPKHHNTPPQIPSPRSPVFERLKELEGTGVNVLKLYDIRDDDESPTGHHTSENDDSKSVGWETSDTEHDNIELDSSWESDPEDYGEGATDCD
ncbi:hypothetical protein AAG570_014153 [Ranatra chinensis]|uniref:Uncharacterized protein n=1 Tax=Ranatra chinensis TaxID=642074 RepID=A0ABD0YDN0_9HEMI